MMFRYMAIVWNDRNEADAATAASLLNRIIEVSPDLRVSLACSGMKVLCNAQERVPTNRCRLAGDSGIVLGTLFRTPSLGKEAYNQRLATLQQIDTRLVLDSGGQELIDKYWGRYIAFLNDARRGAKMIIRDPMGGLPCFICKHYGVTVAFSSLEDCLRTGVFRFTLNWRHVAARVALGSWTVRETGLQECMELQPGHCFRISSDKATQTALWSALAVAARGQLDDINVAASSLRAMVQSCTNSWASCYDSLLTDISGGLDSAIVAACLARAPSKPTLTGVKFNDAYTQPGEARRARLVADRMGYELVDIKLQHKPTPIDRLLAADLTVNLELDVGVCEALDAKNKLAHEHGATGLFNGDPGDVLFGATTREFGAIDYVHHHGLDKRALKICLDVALMTDRSWWSVVAEAIKKPKPISTRDLAEATMAYRHLPADRPRQVMKENSELYHPITPVACRVRGMSEFISLFTGGAQYYNYFGTEANNIDADPEPVYILRSQPLVELCLRIPPHIKNAGGRERWVARLAFMNDLPPEITSTLWKDPAPNCTHVRLLRSMGSIREFLNDGMLVKEHMLDRRMLQDALTIGPVRRAADPSEVQDYLMAELWVRRMTRALASDRHSSARPSAASA